MTTGANRAIGELDVPGVGVGARRVDARERAVHQIEMMATQLPGLNGFALAPLNAMTIAPRSTLPSPGHPVITIDSDLPTPCGSSTSARSTPRRRHRGNTLIR